MADSPEYTAADLQALHADEAKFASVDLTRNTFQKNLQEAAIEVLEFTRTFVTNILPDDLRYTIHYGCSYDGNPLEGDEKTFPEDYPGGPVTTISVEEVVTRLWRDGFVPEWINVTVGGEDGRRTEIKLECCGRYSASPRMMYHIREGRPPFHLLGPEMPLHLEDEPREKFDLYWNK